MSVLETGENNYTFFQTPPYFFNLQTVIEKYEWLDFDKKHSLLPLSLCLEVQSVGIIQLVKYEKIELHCPWMNMMNFEGIW